MNNVVDNDPHKIFRSNIDIAFDGIPGKDFLEPYKAVTDLKKLQLI